MDNLRKVTSDMNNKGHMKLVALASFLILIGVFITAYGLGAAGGSSTNGNDNDTFMDRIIADGEADICVGKHDRPRTIGTNDFYNITRRRHSDYR